jgi:hypothetical protein
MAEASRKNIQKTEKWRAEKCLPRFVADAAPHGAGLFAPGEHCFDDTPRAQPNSIFLSLLFCTDFTVRNELKRFS